MVKMAERKCDDKNCPIHGSLKCRGMGFVGTIISTKMHRTAILEWEWKHFLPKYERYEKRRTRIKVHNPACIDAKDGDIVKVMECRPLSKTKHFVIVEKLGVEKGFRERMEAEEAAKVIEKEKPEESKEKETKSKEKVEEKQE
ncbi:30S ribosomal protein S17 [Candidatus Woesearchaeota archaeon]|nr:30S ribosomal protein S17 [Candidatus Woesearchaeota archaeon]